MRKVLLIVFSLIVALSFAGCSTPTSVLNPGDSYKTSSRDFPTSTTFGATGSILDNSGIISQQNLGLWVNGVGKTTTAPDVAVLTLGVESQQKSVKQAQNDVSNSMNNIMQVLNNYGVVDKDIQTSGYNIQQVVVQQAVIYDAPMMEQLPSSVMEGSVSSSGVFYKGQSQKEIVEYKVSNTINAKIRNIGKTGAIVDDVVSSGGDLIRINGVSFSVDDPTPFYQIARDKAVLYAMDKAKQISQISGIKLGKLIYVSESNSYYVSPISNYARIDAPMGMGSSAPSSISGGELEFQVSVEMVYEIN